LTLPSRVASKTKTAFAFAEISLIKSLLVALPVSSSVVATIAALPVIPYISDNA
jgi:hypothetical protein